MTGPTDSAMSALYPFLAATPPADVDGVLADLRQSTMEKTREIIGLRQQVLERDRDRLVVCAEELARAFAAGGRLFAFGNGGSATDAAELANLFMDLPSPAPPLPAAVLTSDMATVTALCNDVGFDVVFARQLAAFARPGDIAVGLSTSGNSSNLLAAFEQARRLGMVTVGLSGSSGGRMAEPGQVQHLFVMPSASVHRIQEAQTTVYHVLWELAVAGYMRRRAAATAPGPPRQHDDISVG